MSVDIVTRLRNCDCIPNCLCGEAADQIERLRNELAARCGDHGPGARTAGPVETFIPEAL